MDNNNKIIKYKGMIRRACISTLAWLENNPNPTQEKAQELLELRGKVKEAIFNYFDNIKDWEKHTTTLPLDKTRLFEQQQWLEENQHPEGNGN